MIEAVDKVKGVLAVFHRFLKGNIFVFLQEAVVSFRILEIHLCCFWKAICFGKMEALHSLYFCLSPPFFRISVAKRATVMMTAAIRASPCYLAGRGGLPGAT